MNLPLNGRVAIIDDQIKQAEPLMKIFSKKQIPFTYFSGESNYLPDEDDNLNDIRVLFLDINLIDDSVQNDKVLKGRLIPVLKRVISKDNYPYVIIYWSRHQNQSDKKLIEKEIFGNDLKDRKPIGFLSAVKSDFFNFDGSMTDDFEDKIGELFNSINLLISKSPVYSYLLNWENKVHLSADKTLEEVFSNYNKFDNWSDNANFIFNKLGVSFSGKSFANQNAESRIKSSYNALNIVFADTLENNINNSNVPNPKKLSISATAKNLESINNINKKLLISDEKEPLHYSGTVIEILDKKKTSNYENLLDAVLTDNGKKKKAEIILSWKKIWLNVTPLCDTVQGKIVSHRLVSGILVVAFKDMKKAFHNNEAVYISPSFTYDKKDYAIIIDFRHFFTLPQLGKSKNRKSIFRIRQQLLAEIQSKLSRHINRQGVLFLDDRS
ncbi:MAG: hypothetical protein ACOVOQ_13215 [Flavobacterium sp.]